MPKVLLMVKARGACKFHQLVLNVALNLVDGRGEESLALNGWASIRNCV
jgi:hypothetical protein